MQYSFMEIIEMEAINFMELANELGYDDVGFWYDIELGRLDDEKMLSLHKYLQQNVKWYDPNNVYELNRGKHRAEKETVDTILAK